MLFVKHTHRLEKSTAARVRIVFTLLPGHMCDVFTFKTGVTSVCGYLTGKELKACVYALVCVHEHVCGH